MKFYETCVGGGAVTMELLGVKPFLRWLGGKRWLAARVLAELDVHHNDVWSTRLADADADLVAVWQAVSGAPEKLIADVESLPNTVESYYELRASEPDEGFRATRAMWLNLMAFNGLWRKNAAGKFNMPPDPKRLERPPIKSWSQAVRDAHMALALRSAEIVRRDVIATLNLAGSGDAAYVDTPYLPEVSTKTDFTGYTNSSLDWRDPRAHGVVAAAAAEAVRRGSRVAISNSAATRQLYTDLLGGLPGFRVLEVSGRRSVSCKGDGRIVVPEILVVAGVKP